MFKDIKFTHILGFNDLYPPKPASKEIPEWYQKTEPYVSGKKELPNANINETIKKCVPVFDAITAGYILFTPTDLEVTHKNGSPYYQWPDKKIIEFHPVEQAYLHPLANNAPYPKWISPWAIETPKGYSTLFISPLHRESVFTSVPAIVDTDSYTGLINFPFVLNDIKWEGMIPAGTPMIQAIPFKRDAFKMKMGSEKEIKKSLYHDTYVRSMWRNKYKTLFWQRKEYK